MIDNRPNPDQLLKQVSEEESRQVRGKLKIFFGYAAGVGKTYAMLQSAHLAKDNGIDVVAGYIEPHTRPETMALLEGLEVMQPLKIPYRGIELREFDLDSAILRRPGLILVDELAHSNAPVCRHVKRYQDIQELLKVGIDVYTTVNVQHLESLTDIVASITGVLVQERIPDFIFDEADQIELVDIEPEMLLSRLQAGKVYRKDRAQKAMDNFFSPDNLTALREIALRRTADQVNRVTQMCRERNRESEFFTGEHILVCLSTSPSNAKVIRSAARMASAFKAKFTAVYVETPDSDKMEEDDNRRYQMNIRLVEQLGATVVTLYGSEVSVQIAEYARISGVSKIVLGRSYTKRGLFAGKESFSDQLTHLLPNLEIYLIPDTYTEKYKGGGNSVHRKRHRVIGPEVPRDITVLFGMGIATTIIALLFRYLNLEPSNIITVYILGVLLTALITEKQIYCFLASVLSVLCYNFFFVLPFYSLRVYNPASVVTFGIMFLSGFITAFLAKKVKSYGRGEALRAYRTEVLLETSQRLQCAKNYTEIAEAVGGQVSKLLSRDVIFYPGNPSDKIKTFNFPIEANSCIQELFKEDEKAVAAWSYRNNKHAGATTSTLPGSKGLYLTIRSGTKVFGVIGIYMGKDHIRSFELGLMSAILNEGAMAFDGCMK